MRIISPISSSFCSITGTLISKPAFLARYSRSLTQLFARYQTPEDNSWIESWFRILKYDWLRFKDYVSFTQLERMIENFIDVYNYLRYHGAINYVTPEQRHSGEAEAVLEARSERKRLARLRRLEINHNSKNQIQWKMAA